MTEDPRRGMNPPSVEAHPNGKPPAVGQEAERRVLRRADKIDPNSIDDYVSLEGYAALRRVLADVTPEGVIAEVEKSGLRGRGGHGFNTAGKWRAVASSSVRERYVVANAFGGEPTAFGDRTLLEKDPHAVVEGLIITAYAVGAGKGYLYCCLNSKEAVQRVRQAVRQAQERGFLGSSILGSSFSFDVTVVTAPHGFAAGEQTAAVYVIEGQRPMPSPPRELAQDGLWGRPTLVNNAETLCNIPWIVLNGAAKFREVGSATDPGTKLITLTGGLNRPGVKEVPFGITFAEIIDKYGGGIRAGHTIKAAQVGGPHAAVFTPALLETKLEYDAVRAARTGLAAGGVVVLDEEACILDFVRSRLQFLASECCGRCVPGRIGTQRLLFLVDQIARGDGRPDDLDLLGELAQKVSAGAACDFGFAAPFPILSALGNFREELEAHVVDKRCPAGRCDLTPSNLAEKREDYWRRKWPIRR